MRILENVQIYKPFDSDIVFEKIISIKQLDKQQVYDLEIEGTHNFIANDIVAHNTNGDGNNSALPFVNTSGLVLLMHFNNESAFGENATGNSADRVYDFSVDVNGERSESTHNNGTTKNGATVNKTNYKLGGGAGEFDGVNDYVNLPNTVINGLPIVTASFWIKTSKTEAQTIIIGANANYVGGDNDYLLFFASNTDFRQYGRTDAGEFLVSWTISSVSTNTWKHFVVIANTNTDQATLYIDGVSQSTQNFALARGAFVVDPGGLMIGQEQDSVGGI